MSRSSTMVSAAVGAPRRPSHVATSPRSSPRPWRAKRLPGDARSAPRNPWHRRARCASPGHWQCWSCHGRKRWRRHRADLAHLLAKQALGHGRHGVEHTVQAMSARPAQDENGPASSMTGSVLGTQTMVVTPPAAAARLAVAKVSRCSCPGSPAETSMSMRPGASTQPNNRRYRHSVMPADVGDLAVNDQHAAHLVEAGERIDQPCIDEGRTVRAEIGWKPGRRFWQMAGERLNSCCAPRRPSRPARDERSMSSATLQSISTPRFIGPGCMMSASRAWRCASLCVVEAEERNVFRADRRIELGPHPLRLEPEHHDDVTAVDRPSATSRYRPRRRAGSMRDGISVAGATTRTRAPSC